LSITKFATAATTNYFGIPEITSRFVRLVTTTKLQHSTAASVEKLNLCQMEIIETNRSKNAFPKFFGLMRVGVFVSLQTRRANRSPLGWENLRN